MPEASNEETWLTKAEAALRLGVSERTVETWIANRKLGSRPLPRPGKRPATMVDPADVERIAAEQHRGAILPAEPAGMLGGPGPQLLHLAQLLARQRPRPFLTLGEAAAYSGLPAGLIRKLIRSGKLAAARHSEEWFLKTADLENLSLSEDRESQRKGKREVRHRAAQ